MPWVAVGLIPAHAPLGTALVEPFDLGNGIQLAPVPDYLEHLAGPGLDWAHLRWLSSTTDYVLLCPYELEADPGFILSVSQEEVGTRLCIANLAVWLAEPGTDLRFRYTLHLDRSQGAQGLRHTFPGLPLYSLREKRPTTFAVLDEARRLNDHMATLPKGGPVWIAIYNGWQALTVGGFFGRYAQLWTALEALFGPRKGDAVTFRVSQNLAYFLANTVEDRLPLFRRAKRAYDRRSSVVHGEGAEIAEAEYMPLIQEAEDWLREALVRILRSPDHLDAFETAKKRDAYFERLVFGEEAEPGH